MDSISSKSTRQVAIADYIWEAFEGMARAMGSDRDALINQAMFAFARLHGFLEASSVPERVRSRSGREPGDEPAPLDSHLAGSSLESHQEGSALYLITDAGEMHQVRKDHFLIGRGKHCDFVINSGKVSREHAVILCEGSEYFIEDRGSANGTWFNKQRINRRKVADGDEYFICNDKIRLAMR